MIRPRQIDGRDISELEISKGVGQTGAAAMVVATTWVYHFVRVTRTWNPGYIHQWNFAKQTEK
jgi:hypothetical protein